MKQARSRGSNRAEKTSTMKQDSQTPAQSNPASLGSNFNTGWFRAVRTPDALELIKRNRNAFILAYMIAVRSRYTNTFNADNLGLGEALLGDFENYGMTEQEYRTAKAQLEKWRFATFQATNKGTEIGRASCRERV